MMDAPLCGDASSSSPRDAMGVRVEQRGARRRSAMSATESLVTGRRTTAATGVATTTCARTTWRMAATTLVLPPVRVLGPHPLLLRLLRRQNDHWLAEETKRFRGIVKRSGRTSSTVPSASRNSMPPALARFSRSLTASETGR